MPLVYQQNINETTKIGVWHIAEEEAFFLEQVPLQRSITHPHKRLQHLAGRLLLKELYPAFPIELIKIADTRKPFLEDEAFHFSIAHSGHYAAVIVSTSHRVGVDIEWENPKLSLIKNKFLSEDELSRLPTPDSRLLTLSWAVKESVFKWSGAGGVDFRKDIQIKNMDVDIVHCLFKNEKDLEIHFTGVEENFLAWILTLH